MDLITTHINADFDAISSLIAAKKLYPKARLMLPGSQKRYIRNFLALIEDQIPLEQEKNCNYEDVSRLIIVDNRYKERIGQTKILLDKKDIKIHIYDHHLRRENDIKGTKDIYEKVGATVTILLRILDKKGKLKLTPIEATLMLLGIYEETNSLSYSMTTNDDIEMVAKLLQFGAKINLVSSYLKRELSNFELLTMMEPAQPAEGSHLKGLTKSNHRKIKNLKKKMDDFLSVKILKTIKQIGAIADKQGVKAFLVGGFVRDLILEKRNYDIDIVVEGSAIEFAKVLSRELKGTLVLFERFGTAKIIKDWPKCLGASLDSENKLKIDIATARKEKYIQPAVLPMVEFSSLKEDLYRRDFTMNAMAIDINYKNFGLFLDYFGGIQDLAKGIVRVLHDNSFIDDPTRIFRAVRFEQRFGFSIEKHSEYLIQHAIKKEMFKWTENQRIREELIRILKENSPENSIVRMSDLLELRFIHPELKLRKDFRGVFKRLKRFLKWYNKYTFSKKTFLKKWLMSFMLMLDNLDPGQMEDVLSRFVFTRNESVKLKNYARHSKNVIKKISGKKKMKPGRIYDILKGLSPETLICIMSRTSVRVAQMRIKKYIMEYSGIKIKTNGEDLKKLGFSPGPEFNDILKELLHAKLDKKIATKRDEIRFIKNILS